MEYIINNHTARECLIKMHEHFKNLEISTTATVLLPDNVKKGSALHYRYLFYSCLLNYGMKSSKLHENLICLYKEMPLLFEPQYVCDTYICDYSELADILRSYVHVRYPNQCAKNWVFLSNFLHTHYHDDPKELFVGRYMYADFQSAISQIKGLGQKTGGLLLRLLIDEKLIEPIDGITDIPIDRHDIDLCVWLGIISGITIEEVKKNKKVIKLLSSIWVAAAKDLTISPSLADQYMWIIGSRYCSKKQCHICPLVNNCINGGKVHEEDLYCRTNV